MIEAIIRPHIYYTSIDQFFSAGSSGNREFQPDKVIKSADQRLLVVNASDEDWGPNHHEVYHAYLSNLQRPFVLLTGDCRAHDPSKNCFWYQDSYFWALKKYQQFTGNISSSRQFLASSISRFARPHRIYFWLRFQEQIDDPGVIFTMRSGQGSITRHDDVVLDSSDHDRWVAESQNLEDQDHVPFFGHYDHPTWTHSYLNVVLESTVTSFGHTTEKIWLPIIAGQLFMVYGNPGVISVLRNQGVDVFDDIIDHDYYDKESDPKNRAHLVIKLLKKTLSALDMHEVWQRTKSRRVKNMLQFWQLKFIPEQTRELLDYLKLSHPRSATT